MMRRALLVLAALAVTGCERQPAASVTIQSPQDGAMIAGDSVHVQLAATGVEIVPADGEPTPGRAHHHLFLDVDVTPAGQPIPDATEMAGVKHLGTGATGFTYRDLEPGQHRLIAVLARGDHVPLEPWATDTISFTVTAADTAATATPGR